MQECPICHKPYDFLVHPGEIVLCSKECNREYMDRVNKDIESYLKKLNGGILPYEY